MRILVVEDDKLLNSTLCYNLSMSGYDVDSALSKGAAMRFFTEEKYGLAVLDVNLPDGNGFDLCSEIKKCLRHFSPLAPIHGGIRGFFLWRFPA